MECALAADPHPRDFVEKRVFYARVIQKLRSRAEWARLRPHISLQRSILRVLIESGRIQGKCTKNAHTRKVQGGRANVFVGLRLSTTPASNYASNKEDESPERGASRSAPRSAPRGHRLCDDFLNLKHSRTINVFMGLTAAKAEKKRANSAKRSMAYRARSASRATAASAATAVSAARALSVK